MSQGDLPPTPLEFTVSPESEPPTNIHVLIGRNGVGKTHLLNNMARSLADPSTDLADVGSFTFAQGADQTSFANLVSVTFSAFDPFEPISSPQNRANNLPYTYIGLKSRDSCRRSARLPELLRRCPAHMGRHVGEQGE
jgi:ATPase subunit of ABC transporter with duplicated ATPase domains